ncbi:hypothetical protein BKA70DRAFT_1275444 [Coprinopsis sp. MPI-PUGE-AT-0042]|nr:hypothetical protein BKA70DRAFT_1275444 [Coprinopsis sp. MPI-PUGE-AT-0042]
MVCIVINLEVPNLRPQVPATLNSILAPSSSERKLRQFEIGAAQETHFTPVIQVLPKILAAFPLLERLRIALDASSPPSPASMRALGAQYPQLRDLAAGLSPIEAPQNVSLFLYKVFPNLTPWGIRRSLATPLVGRKSGGKLMRCGRHREMDSLSCSKGTRFSHQISRRVCLARLSTGRRCRDCCHTLTYRILVPFFE